MDETSENENLRALRDRIQKEGNPEFEDTSSVDQVRAKFRQISLLTENKRTAARIDDELYHFDRWLMALKTDPNKLYTTAPTDPYLAETGASDPLPAYLLVETPLHNPKLWDTICKQFGVGLPDNLTLSEFIRQADHNEWRQGNIPKSLGGSIFLPPLTFKTDIPNVAFFIERFLTHPEKPPVVPGTLALSQTKLLFRPEALSKYLPPRP